MVSLDVTEDGWEGILGSSSLPMMADSNGRGIIVDSSSGSSEEVKKRKKERRRNETGNRAGFIKLDAGSTTEYV